MKGDKEWLPTVFSTTVLASLGSRLWIGLCRVERKGNGIVNDQIYGALIFFPVFYLALNCIYPD